MSKLLQREAGELMAQLQKSDENERTLEILRALDGVEVTVTTLQELKIGAVVAKYRKHEDTAVAEVAKALIKKWKAVAADAGVLGSPRESKPSTPRGERPAKKEQVKEPAGDLSFTKTLSKFRDTMRSRLLDVMKADIDPSAACYTVASAIEEQLTALFHRAETDADQKREYVAKLRQLTFNLKKNGNLRDRLLSGEVSAERLCAMSVEQLATKELQQERERMAQYQHDARSLDWEKKNRERINQTIGVDDSKGMFQCGKCRSKRVANYEKQTRSADEPMTQFFECVDCGNRWRF